MVKVVSPVRSDRLLPFLSKACACEKEKEEKKKRKRERETADIPDVELKLGMHEGFDIESLCGHDVSDVFVAKPPENGRLAGIVEAKNQNTSFVIAPLQFPARFQRG